MSGPSSINSLVTADMATAVKVIPSFSGLPEEDISSWVANASFLISLYSLSEGEAIKVIASCLKGMAFDWLRELLTKERDINLARIFAGLEQRFQSRANVTKVAQRFLEDSIPSSSGEFFAMMNDASYLFNRGYMSFDALSDRIISRSPPEIRSAIWQAASSLRSIFDLSKVVERVVPLAFGKDGLMAAKVKFSVSQASSNTGPRKANNKSSFFCHLHGHGSHSSDRCYKLKEMRLRKKPFVSNVVADTDSNSGPEEKEMNSSYPYIFPMLYSCVNSKNPFYTEACVFGLQAKVLIDTGADVSLIPERLVKSSCFSRSFKEEAFAANGLPIKILGAVYKVPIQISNKEYVIPKALISDQIRFVILGSDLIFSFPDLLSDRLSGRLASLPFPGHFSPHNTLSCLSYPPVSGVQAIAAPLASSSSQHMPFPVAPQCSILSPFPKSTANGSSLASPVLLSELFKSLPPSIFRTLSKFQDIFQTEISSLTLCSAAAHTIDTADALPIQAPLRRTPVHWESQIQDEIKKNLRLGIIRESSSPWRSAVVPVPKPDGSLRLCIDFRPLNSVTVKDTYPIPRIDEILDLLAGASVFSTLDATSGYFQLAMNPGDIPKTAFGWKDGLFEFVRMPFGLCNAPATFQRAMDSILHSEKGKFVIPYFDDIIIFSKSLEEHACHLDVVLSRLKLAGLSLNHKKCHFAKSSIKILGNVVSEGVVKPDPEKVRVIKDFKTPRSIKELRGFLGFANYFRHFIPNFGLLAEPLTSLLKGHTKGSSQAVVWNSSAEKSFDLIKSSLSESTVRSQPDFSKPFILTTDASDRAIGAILSQEVSPGCEKMIYAFSKVLDQAQRHYGITDRELLAVVKAVQYFKHYLLGRQFTLRTDHLALKYLESSKNDNSRLMRWSFILQEFNFKVDYVRGEENASDFLSRPTISVLSSTPCLYSCSGKCEVSDLSIRSRILKEYHLFAGHGSSENMKFLILERYFWPGICKDIEQFVSSCSICLQSGRVRINSKNRIIISERPNQLWVCDLIGRLPTTPRGHKFIFVAIDHYTKWVESVPLRSKQAVEVSKAFHKAVVLKHGVPEAVLTDQGLEFKSSLFASVLKEIGTEHIFASPSHHKTTGVVERAIQTLFGKLVKLSNFRSKNWDLCLSKATFGCNISFHRAISTSPFLFTRGLSPQFPVDDLTGASPVRKSKEFLARVRDKSFKKYAKRYIEKGKVTLSNPLNIGDPVLIFREVLGDEFKSRWRPNFVIRKIILPDAFLVSNGRSFLRVNKSHVKFDHSKMARGMSSPPS